MVMAKLDFVSIADTPQETLEHMLDVAKQLKRQLKSTGHNDPILAGKVLACIFEKPSLRTRVSFEVAMDQLGGDALSIGEAEVGLGKRESVADVARVLGSMCDAIMARVYEHAKLKIMQQHARVPVINGLSDYSHPCQAMGDLMTIDEHFNGLKGRTLAFIGDGNNVARSLMVACARFGMKFRIASPPGYELETTLLDRLMGQCRNLDFVSAKAPEDVIYDADVIYTDTWVSMGQEAEKAQRVSVFKPYQVNEAMLAKAPKTCMVMHCLPAYRGMEITDAALDGPQSLVFQQAENRLHFQKGLLAVLVGGA